MNAIRRACVLAALLTSAGAGAQAPDRPSELVYLHGSALQAHRVVAIGDLAAQPAALQASFVQSRGAPGAEQRSTVRGVRLAGLNTAARENWKNLLVTVTATDGYRAQFTWAELTNTAVGAQVLLVYERDGQPLDAREGRIGLLSTGDLRLGPRHVRNALRVEVRAVAD